MTSSGGKRRIVGMAGGTFWLIAASTGFAILSLLWIGTPMARATLVAIAGLAGVLVVINTRALLSARRIPDEMVPRTTDDLRIVRGFTRIVVAEVAGIVVVNTLCGIYRQNNLMAPLDLIVVGLHFVALSRLFKVPRYTVMGWLFCAVPVGTMIAVPEASQFGRAPVWFVMPSLLCALVVWLTAAGNLREIVRLTHALDSR
jgi:hypothetical protein